MRQLFKLPKNVTHCVTNQRVRINSMIIVESKRKKAATTLKNYPDANPDSFNTVIEENYEDYVKEKGYISKEKFRQIVYQYFIQTADDNRAFYNFEDII